MSLPVSLLPRPLPDSPPPNSIAKEQELRDGVKPAYGAFVDRRADVRETTTLPPNPFDPTSLSFDLSLAVPTSLEEALALGRTILAGEPAATKSKGRKSKGKGKGKEEVVDELSSTLAEVRLEVCHFTLARSGASLTSPFIADCQLPPPHSPTGSILPSRLLLRLHPQLPIASSPHRPSPTRPHRLGDLSRPFHLFGGRHCHLWSTTERYRRRSRRFITPWWTK